MIKSKSFNYNVSKSSNMKKSKSLDGIKYLIKKCTNLSKVSTSFGDFGSLILNGNQKVISYGEYMNKNINKPCPKQKRQKIIHTYYKQLLSSL